MKYSTVFGRIKLGCLAAAFVVFGCGGFIFADSLPLDANQEAVGSPTMAPVMVVPSVVRKPRPLEPTPAPTRAPTPSSPVVGDDDDDDDDSCASGDDDDDDGRRALVKKRAKRGRKTKKSCKKDTSSASF